MKMLYLSQPLAKDKFEEVRKVRKMILQHLTEKRIILDQNHEYQFTYHWLMPVIDESIKHTMGDKYFKNITMEIGKRLQAFGNADHFIFIDQWMCFPECQLDKYILDLYGKTNYLTFRVKENKLKLA